MRINLIKIINPLSRKSLAAQSSQLAAYGLLIAVCCLLNACKPDVVGGGLGAKPKPDFTIVQGANANSVVLINKTSMAGIPYWRVVSTGQKFTGDTAKLSFVFAGTYNVMLIVAGNGGLDSVVKPVTIAQNDPNACNGTAIGFLTGCGTKTWKINPAAGAYKVGDADPDAGNWWSSGAGDVSARSCEFNDTYTFTFNAAGTFVYDNKGDFYADGYIGANGNDCENNAQFTAVQKPWGSGNFNYTVTEKTGLKGLGQLTVTGLGAHIGLQKVTSNGEVTSGPVSSITYDVLEMTHDPGGFDILKLTVALPGGGWWTFALRSY